MLDIPLGFVEQFEEILKSYQFEDTNFSSFNCLPNFRAEDFPLLLMYFECHSPLNPRDAAV